MRGTPSGLHLPLGLGMKTRLYLNLGNGGISFSFSNICDILLSLSRYARISSSVLRGFTKKSVSPYSIVCLSSLFNIFSSNVEL